MAKVTDKREKRGFLPFPKTSRSFRLIFLVMYMGIIAALIYFNLISLCGNQFLFGDAGALVGILLFLLGIERFEHQRYGSNAPARVAWAFMLGRMVLLEAVTMLDCSGYSRFLYPVIPFTAYFSLGPRASDWLGLFYSLVYLGKVWLADLAWYADVEALSNLMIYALLLIFLPVMARVIRRDEESRERLERLLADLEATNRRLQAYAEQVAELAATEERNRLARDIHDSLGHFLTAVNIQLEKALAFWTRDPAQAEQAIRDAKQSAGEALRDVRRSVSALRQAEDGFSLRQALADLVAGMEDGRLTIQLHIKGRETGYARPALMALYRAAQEGLTNVQKHALAGQVTLTVELGETEACLRLQDDGRGFDTAVLDDLAASPHHSFGLQGIRERLELVRGNMTVNSGPAGTELVVTVPRKLKLKVR